MSDPEIPIETMVKLEAILKDIRTFGTTGEFGDFQLDMESFHQCYINFGSDWRERYSLIKRQITGPLQHQYLMRDMDVFRIESGVVHDPELSRFLIGLYADTIGAGDPDMTGRMLSAWIVGCLSRIAGGADANEVFGLKNKRGRASGTSSHSHAMIAVSYAIYTRTGMTAPQALRACVEEYNYVDRHMATIVSAYPVPDHIPTELLLDLKKNGRAGSQL